MCPRKCTARTHDSKQASQRDAATHSAHNFGPQWHGRVCVGKMRCWPWVGLIALPPSIRRRRYLETQAALAAGLLTCIFEQAAAAAAAAAAKPPSCVSCMYDAHTALQTMHPPPFRKSVQGCGQRYCASMPAAGSRYDREHTMPCQYQSTAHIRQIPLTWLTRHMAMQLQ